MTKAELKEKALSLPCEPGVYIMQDKTNTVIYVGKAKKLKNRVSQYFIDSSAHTPKTRLMVSKIDHFDVIVAASEFEALVLECSLIKRHMPKYNILLKDDKGYPYLRLDMKQPYPRMTLASRTADDGARYFGPFGGRYLTQKVIDTLQQTFRLPCCNRRFPGDFGKERPCLHYQMGNCDGWCQGTLPQREYVSRMEQVQQLLQGNYRQVADGLRVQMEQAAEALEFERAAALRDRMQAIKALGQKQMVTAGRVADTDAVGYYQTEAKGCFAVLHYTGGNLVDKEYEMVPLSDSEPEAVSSLLKQFYLGRGAAPREILLPCEIEDAAPFEQLLWQRLQKKVRIRVPQRGDSARLVELAVKNARQEAERLTSADERLKGSLALLQQRLGLERPPRRMEAYDISNLAGTDIVASMTVFCDGKPKKSDYRHFKLEGLDGQDDYGAMRQVLRRRFTHYLQGDKGFDVLPDVLLIDGGAAHARAVQDELTPMGIEVPIYGMVKDDRHRTRALVTPEGMELGIDAQQSLFALIGRIQEQTHRFAISYHHKLRSRRVQGSTLDKIPGIGEKRRQLLLKRFQTVSAVGQASLQELRALLPADAAMSVYRYFHPQEDES
ncbi:MAG: excinuclease ABC subunit UvrC [Firmicutes bacterium]|nr:excinuclease ABC subunit UvrC [Bacillota bacterium]